MFNHTYLSHNHHYQDIRKLLQHPALGQRERLQTPAVCTERHYNVSPYS